MGHAAKIFAITILAAAGAGFAAPRNAVQSTYLYSLDDGAAKRAVGWASLTWDASANELFVVSGGVVDIFDDNGLATYAFGDERAFGMPRAAAALENGDIYVLAAADETTTLVRCNFRGEPQARVELKGAPAAFQRSFNPAQIVVHDGKLYLADRESMKVLVVTPDGAAAASYDLGDLLGIGSRDRSEAMMRGFNVDAKGNLLVTVASVYAAFVVSPDGKVRSFGQRGSAPGRFNVVAGIAADEDGRLYVADSLRSVVMVFDPAFQFLGEFGYRGTDAESLTSPFNLAVASGRVFVSQSRGAVKAFAVTFD